jgi:hypothetical protein
MKKGTYAVAWALLGTLVVTSGVAIAQSAPEESRAPTPELSPAPEDGSIGPETRSFGVVGLPDCPEGETEVFFVTYARDDTETSCATVVSCTNLDSSPHAVTCQFFLGFGNTQRGADASVALGPGETAECATRDPDPTGIFVVNANAATADFEGKGRICAETTRLACHAHLACSGTGLEALTLIKREF